MPTLQFKGKSIIWNHHLSVPYHALESATELDFQPEKADGNLIIEGDNLLALKALLPLYAGKIKCIYIDPPYNTGNEGWVYNDNANSPLLRDWLGHVVGKDDLTRHDKWLCMMTPRLKLLRELLADNGVIFISIDDKEFQNLRALMDEIFGEMNFVSVITIKANPRGRQSESDVATIHDYCVCYAKNNGLLELGGLPLTQEDIDDFDQLDENGEPWRELGLRQRGSASLRIDRPDMYFPIYVDPKTNTISLEKDKKHYIEVLPKKSDGREGRWMWSPKKVREEINRVYARMVEKRGEYDIFVMDYLNRENGPRTTKVKSIWADKEVNTELGGKEFKQLLPGVTFPYPKPVGLLKRIVTIASDSDSMILDSFAGSGTTAQAVLDLNKEDGVNRKFILVQMTEATPAEPQKNICKDITRERVKRAIEKYGYASGFAYQRVGPAMDAETLLAGQLPEAWQFGRYVFYLCTGRQSAAPLQALADNLYCVGESGEAGVYLIYSPDYETLTRLALNLDAAKKITAGGEKKRRIVYAPACFLDEEYLRAKNIEFVGLPYGLFQRKGGEA
jgi:adenine-specific DNA-methyltransferase